MQGLDVRAPACLGKGSPHGYPAVRGGQLSFSTAYRVDRRLAFAVAVASLVLLALAIAAGFATSADAHRGKPKVKVMTRNLYLGADLTPGIQAQNFDQLKDAAGEILNQVDENKFQVRAKGLATEILRHKPDPVGRQEVALWRTR